MKKEDKIDEPAVLSKRKEREREREREEEKVRKEGPGDCFIKVFRLVDLRVHFKTFFKGKHDY